MRHRRTGIDWSKKRKVLANPGSLQVVPSRGRAVLRASQSPSLSILRASQSCTRALPCSINTRVAHDPVSAWEMSADKGCCVHACECAVVLLSLPPALAVCHARHACMLTPVARTGWELRWCRAAQRGFRPQEPAGIHPGAEEGQARHDVRRAGQDQGPQNRCPPCPPCPPCPTKLPPCPTKLPQRAWHTLGWRPSSAILATRQHMHTHWRTGRAGRRAGVWTHAS